MAIPFSIIETLAKEHDSFYVYGEAEIEKSISALKRCFAGADILYSIKCNPNKNVLNAVFSRGLGADAASAAAAGEFAAFSALYPSTRLIIETGRYAVCKSGIYVSRVMDRKVSRGKTYIILKNTLNAFMRPALARLIFKYCNEYSPAGSEPLFSGADAFEFIAPYPERPCETVTLAGNLCTACDTVAEDITLPRVERGDIVLMTNAGSYAAALSPMQFSSQGAIPEVFITKDGKTI